MSHPLVEPTHVRVTLFLTWAGIGLGLFLLAMVTLMQVSISSVGSDTDMLDGPFDNIAVGVLIGLVLSSLVVQVWVRLARGQRHLASMMLATRPIIAHAYVGRAAVVTRRDEDTEVIVGPPRKRKRRRHEVRSAGLEGLSPDIIETARSLSERLNHHDK